MQNPIGDIAGHRHDRDPLTNKEDDVDLRGERNEREETKKKETVNRCVRAVRLR